jgi:hypothetical protein
MTLFGSHAQGNALPRDAAPQGRQRLGPTARIPTKKVKWNAGYNGGIGSDAAHARRHRRHS